MAKNCQKGKSCGATCIEKRDVCRKDLGVVAKVLSSVRGDIKMGTNPPPIPEKSPPRSGSSRPLMEVNDDYYGPIKLRYSGTVDIKKFFKENPGSEGLDFSIKWMQKYHPKHAFPGYYKMIPLSEKTPNGYMKFEVWVPEKGDNKDWKPVTGTRYYENLQARDRNKKYLPIAVTEKEIEKWLKNSKGIVSTD